MPWVVPTQRDCVALSASQRQCERTAFSFYCSVREQLPVWMLEDMRSMEVFCWDDCGPRAFLPSEALLYALVHDHQEYARFLLDRYSVSALRTPRCSFCCCCGGTPLLTVAVRYDRVAILGMMVETLRDGGAPEYLDSCGGCAHVANAGKTAVQLALELSQPRCLLLLLLHGARPDGLELALQRLISCDAADHCQARRCLDFLLLFLSEPLAPPRCLQDEAQHWKRLLGNQLFSWLSGLTPPPLLLQALRCVARSGSDRINSLPDFLQLHGWH
ncbi:ankyrin repeat domain-containing protein 9 [Cololabis saira]|uniref:ankyrin repeat domain-containing protein 9 n=1 Tax=Cololabis saira TaxID=129043 RepID=UPI002AD48365|nr:ankyrin repeat domain-containing protein 9 [Cololabis saira]